MTNPLILMNDLTRDYDSYRHPSILAEAARVAARVDLSPVKDKVVAVIGAGGLIGQVLTAVLVPVARLVYRAGVAHGACDFIIHAGGYASPSIFMAEPHITFTAGSRITEYLLWSGEAQRDVPPRHKSPKFLFLSSSEIYSGAMPPHRETDIGTITPDHPRAPYVIGKLAGETLCHIARAEGVDAKIARVSLAYGPGTRKGDGRVLNQFIERALTRKQISLRDSGGALRTYCYIADTVEMLLNVLLHGKQAVYNVGGEAIVSINELATLIGEMTGAAVDWPATSADPAAPGVVRMDISRYVAEFGRPDFVPLEEGLRRTIEYQRGLYA